MQRSALSPGVPLDRRATVVIWPRAISLESLLYLSIMTAAVLSRFWNLGAGALHHDESMHAYYSWLYATGHGYIHNPLLHGPLLFHLTAITFLLLGESDTTARLMPAIFGTVLVGLPWFLRGPRLLGRWGALSASALILVSPSILYYSRHLRHDMFTLTLTMVLAISIVRYLEQPQRRWTVTGAVSIGLMLANHEIVFAVLAIFALYLYAILALDRLYIWWRDPRRRHGARLVLIAHGLFILGTAALIVLAPQSRIDNLITIPWDHPTGQEQRDYYARVVASPVVIAFLAIAAISLVMLIAGLRAVRRSDLDDGTPASALLGDAEPGSVAAGTRALWRDQMTLGIALLVVVAIFVALFTTLFTNMHGLVSSTIATDGTLLYWLGQHDVRRGHQPWYYFLLLTPQYELFVVFIAGPMAVAVAVQTARAVLARRRFDQRTVFRGFVAFWFIALFIALSLAGEKMPWLIIHFTLPGLLLAAMVVGALIERTIQASRDRSFGLPELGLVGLIIAGGVAFFALGAQGSEPGERWGLVAIPIALCFLAMVVLSVIRDWRRTTFIAAAALILGLSLFQVHAAWRMTYLDGDIPRDMLIYTQTTHDIPMLVSDLEQLSYDAYGDMSLNVYFGGEATWPLWWYLRDFPIRRPAGTPETSALVPIDADVYVVDAVSLTNPDAVNRLDSIFAGYTRQAYILRWAYPESGYRDFAIAPELGPGWSVWTPDGQSPGVMDVLRSIGDSVESAFHQDEQQRLYRLLVYRDITVPLTSWDARFFIYVRNDLLPTFNAVRYGP